MNQNPMVSTQLLKIIVPPKKNEMELPTKKQEKQENQDN